MGKFGKSLKRKKKVEVFKTVYKTSAKIMKAERKGRAIALGPNKARMDAYMKLYWASCFAYVMNKTFKMGHDKIVLMLQKMDEYEDDLTADAVWQYKLSWFKAGLYRECQGFRIHFLNEKQKPEDPNDFISWSKFYMDCILKALYRKMQTIFYWLLHDIWGFGKKRLERAKKELLGMRGMSWNEYCRMWESLRKLRTHKTSPEVLNPERVMGAMKQLINIDKPDEAMAFNAKNLAYKAA